MNKEINKIIANLEGCVGMFDYMLTPTESNLLVSHLKELQQENKKQKEVIEEIKKELLERNILDLLPFDVAGKLCYLLKEVLNVNKEEKQFNETLNKYAYDKNEERYYEINFDVFSPYDYSSEKETFEKAKEWLYEELKELQTNVNLNEVS